LWFLSDTQLANFIGHLKAVGNPPMTFGPSDRAGEQLKRGPMQGAASPYQFYFAVPRKRVLLQLRDKNISPDITRGCAESQRYAVLAFLQFMDQFDSGKSRTSQPPRRIVQTGLYSSRADERNVSTAIRLLILPMLTSLHKNGSFHP
jgi:hypothetical protein